MVAYEQFAINRTGPCFAFPQNGPLAEFHERLRFENHSITIIKTNQP